MDHTENPQGTNRLAAIKGKLGELFKIGPKPETRTATPVSLKKYLLSSAEHIYPLPTAEDFPESFDLGEFGKEAERLMNATRQDPKHREHLTIVCVDFDKKFSFHRASRNIGFVNLPRPEEFGDKSPLFSLHSHHSDTPFSYPDVIGSFYGPPLLGGLFGAIVITPSQKLLFLRTDKTTIPSGKEILEDMSALEQDRKGNNLQMNPKGRLEVAMEADSEHVENLSRSSNIRMFLLTRIAQKCNLKLYSCPIDKNITVLAN